jgi:hypothetical protein
MLRPGFVVFIGALTFLNSPHQTNAVVAVGRSVADAGRDKGFVEHVHYSRRYGWHCGMRNYGYEHRKTCQWTREGGYWGGSEESRYGAWRRRLFGVGGRPVEN